MGVLNTGGDAGNYVKYTSRNKIEIATGNNVRLTVEDTGTTISNDLTVSGKATVTGDVAGGGGYAMGLIFARPNFQTYAGAKGFADMTASYVSGAIPGGTDFGRNFLRIPTVRSGSILGLSLVADYDSIIKSGALTASVTLDGANVACTALGITGTFLQGTTVAKDSITFNPGQGIGVSLTCSDNYLSEPTLTSASWIATVLIEQ